MLLQQRLYVIATKIEQDKPNVLHGLMTPNEEKSIKGCWKTLIQPLRNKNIDCTIDLDIHTDQMWVTCRLYFPV